MSDAVTPSLPGAGLAGRRLADQHDAHQELLQAAIGGDERAFAGLYRAVQPGLLRYLTVLVGADAEDVAAEEIGGEAAALAAFRAVHPAHSPLPSPRRRPMLKSSLLSLLTTKAAMAAAATAAVGTVTVAAATGVLPNPVSGASGTGTGPGGDVTAAASASPSATPSATPSPSLVGLCQAFLAGAMSNPGKAASNPAFTALATAAGASVAQ